MKSLLIVFLAALMGNIFAESDQIKSESPKSQLTAIFQRSSELENYRLKLITQEGDVLFESGPIDLQISKSLIWNTKGDSIAFSAGTHFLMQAFVLIPRDHKYSLEKVPNPENGWDNFHQIPEKWKDTLLIVQIDGPHAGKARNYHYEGTMTIDTSKQFKVVSENINTVEQDAAANP